MPTVTQSGWRLAGHPPGLSAPSGKDGVDARVLRIGDGPGRQAARHPHPEAQCFGLLDNLRVERLVILQARIVSGRVQDWPADVDQGAVEAGALHGLQKLGTALHIGADEVSVGIAGRVRPDQACANVAIGPEEGHDVMIGDRYHRQGSDGLLDGGIGGR